MSDRPTVTANAESVARAPATGYLEGAGHVLPLRVYYEDTDAGGVVYHASYLRFAERARAELLRMTGGEAASLMQERGLGFVARWCSLDYIAPARLGDALDVRTRIVEVRGASFLAVHEIARGMSIIVRIDIRIACVGADGRPGRIPADLRQTLHRLAREPVVRDTAVPESDSQKMER